VSVSWHLRNVRREREVGEAAQSHRRQFTRSSHGPTHPAASHLEPSQGGQTPTQSGAVAAGPTQPACALPLAWPACSCQLPPSFQVRVARSTQMTRQRGRLFRNPHPSISPVSLSCCLVRFDIDVPYRARDLLHWILAITSRSCILSRGGAGGAETLRVSPRMEGCGVRVPSAGVFLSGLRAGVLG
jgi:hypothetical protein